MYVVEQAFRNGSDFDISYLRAKKAEYGWTTVVVPTLKQATKYREEWMAKKAIRGRQDCTEFGIHLKVVKL